MSVTFPETGGAIRRALVPLVGVEWRDSGDPDRKNETTLRGHAAVFNSLSEDLGGFREIIAPGAFRAALRKQPDVRLLMNHDSNYVAARTASGTLELREDADGLHVFARVDRRISWIEDLRVAMQRGDVDQMSFAFDMEDDGDEWAVADEGRVVRTILPDGVRNLYDVSVVAYPAYEHTNVNMRGLFDAAAAAGRIPGYHVPVVASATVGDVPVAPPGVGEESQVAHQRARVVRLERARRNARSRIGKTPTPTRNQ